MSTIEDLKALREQLVSLRGRTAHSISASDDQPRIEALALTHAAILALDAVIDEGKSEKEYQMFFV